VEAAPTAAIEVEAGMRRTLGERTGERRNRTRRREGRRWEFKLK